MRTHNMPVSKSDPNTPPVVEIARSETQSTTVPAAARTMALFEAFARERRELTKSELARLLDLPESSCSDLLNTLHVLGYVSRTANSKRYYPTGKLMTAAAAIAENDPLAAFGAEAVALLSQRAGETSTFGVLDGDGVKMVAVADGTHRLRYVVNVGDRVSLHGTSVGKALLGGVDEAEMARLLRLRPLKPFTAMTKIDPREIEEEVARHRQAGWYMADEEGGIGISSFAVSARIGATTVALSMIGPSDRIRANQEQYLAILKDVEATVFSGADGDKPRRGRGRPAR